MLKKFQSIILLMTITAVFFILNSCGMPATGPAFIKATPIETGKAVVYFYRPWSMFGHSVDAGIKENDSTEEFVKIENGYYYPLIVTPGKYRFWSKMASEAESSILMDVKEGESYYVYISISMGVWIGRPTLEEVLQDRAYPEITTCKLVSKEDIFK